MPYPNEHSARVRDPGDFQADSFRRKNITSGVDIIIGRLKGKSTTETQAYRFDAEKFTAAEAKKWLKDHKIEYKSFEAASPKKTEALADAAGLLHFDPETVDWIKAGEDQVNEAGARRFKMRAYTGGPMQVGYYSAPVVIELSGLTAKAPIPILMNHDLDKIVGHADEVNVGDSSLDLSGAISGGGRESEQVLASSKLGFPWKASVGARPDKMEFIGEGVNTEVNGKTFTGPLYVARKSTLGEVSFVPLAADSKTSASVAAIAAITRRELSAMDQKLRELIECLGLNPDELPEEQRVKIEAKWKGEGEAAIKLPPTPEPIEAEEAELCYEQHCKAIRVSAQRYRDRTDAPSLEAACRDAVIRAIDCKVKAIEAGWDSERFERELKRLKVQAEAIFMRLERPIPPTITQSTTDGQPQILEACFARAVGIQREKHYKSEVLEAADRIGAIGLQELLMRAAHAGGGAGQRMRIDAGNLREVLQAAYSPAIRGAFSSLDVSSLLSNVANKSLLDGFNAIPQSWRSVAAIRSVNDFKTSTAYRLTASLEYEEVGPAGEIKHGTLGNESYTFAAKTYAKLLAITRQDIINDDLGAFNDIRNRLGMGAAIKMNKVFWTAWLAAANGAAFWTADRGNLVTSSALGEPGLGTALKAFRTMAGPDGNMLDLEPAFLLAPPDLEATARKWYASAEMRDTTASTKFGVANIYQNRFVPIIVPELSNSGYTGYSATNWWLLANPAILASAVMCFLNGQQAPTIESADADFDTLGVQFRGFHDFGCAMSEYRASVEAQA